MDDDKDNKMSKFVKLFKELHEGDIQIFKKFNQMMKKDDWKEYESDGDPSEWNIRKSKKPS